MEIFNNVLPYVSIYLAIAFIFWMINAVIAGFNGNTWTAQDFKESLVWPASLAVLLGLIIRVLVERSVARKKQTKQTNKK
jgi:membrane protein implicated in regulation of membrane protease activity